MLAKYGIERAKKQGKLLHKFCEIVQEQIEENRGVSAVEIMDIVDSVFGDAVCI